MAEVYRNLRTRSWSIRIQRRVVRRLPDIVLVDVTFVVRPAGVARIRLRRQREVVAWASGRLVHVENEDLPERGGIRLLFRPYERLDFHTPDGLSVTRCDLLVLDRDGAAWGWNCR